VAKAESGAGLGAAVAELDAEVLEPPQAASVSAAKTRRSAVAPRGDDFDVRERFMAPIPPIVWPQLLRQVPGKRACSARTRRAETPHR
jgi:hypothetical protein